MPNFITQQTLGWVDAKGEQTRTKFFSSADTYANQATNLGNMTAAMSNLTNAQNFSAPGGTGFVTTSGEYGAVSEYESVTDKAVMTFIDTTGQLHRYTIPAPKLGIFLADGLTVDKANTDVVTYVNLVTNTAASTSHFISTRGGAGFSSFVGGLRIKKPNRRRTSIFTLSGNLDEPAE